MNPGGSLPHSQTPTTCPYPVPDQLSPLSHTHFLKNHQRLGRLSGLFATGFPQQNPVRISLLAYTCHMSRPTHSYWFDYPNNVYTEYPRWYNNHKMCVACDWKHRYTLPIMFAEEYKTEMYVIPYFWSIQITVTTRFPATLSKAKCLKITL